MTQPTPSPTPFPLLGITIALGGVAVIAGAMAWWLSLRLGGDLATPWQAIAGMTGLVWLAAMVGLGLTAMLWPLGLMPAVYGAFIGAGCRLILSIMAGVLLVLGLGLPARGVLLTLVAVYLPMLFVETLLVGRAMWKLDSPPADPTASVKPWSTHTPQRGVVL